MRAALEPAGYRLTTAANGLDAAALFAENPKAFDVVVTDLTMPGLTGDRLAEDIHKANPNVPIIIYSGRVASLSLDNLPFISKTLSKPLTGSQLTAAIREVLDKRQVPSG